MPGLLQAVRSLGFCLSDFVGQYNCLVKQIERLVLIYFSISVGYLNLMLIKWLGKAKIKLEPISHCNLFSKQTCRVFSSFLMGNFNSHGNKLKLRCIVLAIIEKY